MIKEFLVRKLVEYDLVPPYIRWEKTVSGIGKTYLEIMQMMKERYGPEGVKELNNVMYDIGYNQADEILDSLGLERNLKGCAYALMAMHRVFGIKSKIKEESDNRVIIHISSCDWGRSRENWGPKACASIAHYETGLVEAILPEATHMYPKKHTLGDEVCKLVIEFHKKKD